MLVLKPVETQNKNATTLLHLLLKQDSISRVDLSRTTGLTKTTISSIITLSIVEESSTISTGNTGKSPIPFHIRYTIGDHFGRQKIKTVLMNAMMNIITGKKGLSYVRLGPKGASNIFPLEGGDK